tara:strand:- start:2579 stop:2914 length:336 start_codon:yes stop_codon:yes gene_type:complete
MDLQDQLRNFFPNHKLSENTSSEISKSSNRHSQTSPLLCKYEKRNGRPTTIVEGFEKIKKEDLKLIAKSIKQKFSVGGSVKGYSIIIQGNIRVDIMNFLSSLGYNVKRVGG